MKKDEEEIRMEQKRIEEEAQQARKEQKEVIDKLLKQLEKQNS